MSIQELSRRAGVTPRTIRYYVEQGLLPPPLRGRPAEYTDEHLRRLALISKLKSQYLPLEEIRDTMQKLSMEQVEELLAQGEQAETHKKEVTSAADYIRRVMERTQVRENYKQRSTPPQYPPDPSLPVQPSPPPATMPAPAPVRQPFSAPPTPSPYWPNGTTPEIREPSVSYEQLGPESQAETWIRVSLAEGIELHYLPASEPRRGEIVARILDAARAILGKRPEKETE